MNLRPLGHGHRATPFNPVRPCAALNEPRHQQPPRMALQHVDHPRRTPARRTYLTVAKGADRRGGISSRKVNEPQRANIARATPNADYGCLPKR